MPAPDLSALSLALGRIPTGLYVVSTRQDDRPLGFVASFLMQTGFRPPSVCVAIAKERPHLAAIRDAGHFAVSVLDRRSEGLMSRFFRRLPPGESPFDDIQSTPAPAGSPVLCDALAWLECRLRSEHDTGDHVAVFGEVTGGALLREGEPSIHLRKTGMIY